MLRKIFKKLDKWVCKENEERLGKEILLKAADIKIVGQFALWESKLSLDLALTVDVDAFTNGDFAIIQKLNELLMKHGLHHDPLSQEIWMPVETEYDPIYEGIYIHGFIAKPEYVLISKAIKNPEKNRDVLTQYLGKGASTLFWTLATKYKWDWRKIKP